MTEQRKKDGIARLETDKLSFVRKEIFDVADQTFHQIARGGDVGDMKVAMQSLNSSQIRKRLHKRDADKYTPLHYAARYNHFDMCSLLCKAGANIHARGEDDLTPLHLLAKYKQKKKSSALPDTDDDDEPEEADNIETLEFFISQGARVNEKDFYGLTPLHHACLRGNKIVVERLLQCPEIDIEAVDKQKMTPLHVVAVYGHGDIAEILLGSGASIRCLDEENGTPVHLASAEGNIEIVKLILDKGKRGTRVNREMGPDYVAQLLSDKDNDGNTPLHLSVHSGHREVAEFLISKCQEIGKIDFLNARRENRETALHLAASNGHLQIVQLLIEKSAQLNVRDDTYSTPLILASKFNHYKVVEYLLQQGAKINAKDADDFTALLIAANYGHPETISLLIEHGADVTAVDKNEKTVLHQCAEEERLEALKELLKRKKVRAMLNVADRFGCTPLHIAAEKGHYSILKLLLDEGSNISLKDEDERTALHLAAIHGRVRVIGELVKNDNSIVHDDDEDANTALHLAALEGRVLCVQELVNAGADISARNVKQWTPLDCCASAGHTKCATVLLEADSPVDPKDKTSTTPLHLACLEGHADMVKLLLSWNADVSLRTKDGRNPLDYAIDYGRTDCAMAMIEGSQWREALRNRTKNIGTDMMTDTPMRKLIKKMPQVAEAVFRNCLTTNGKHEDHKNYEITFDLEFLDDEYACRNWVEQSDTMSESSVTIVSDSSYEVYDESGLVNHESEPYSRDSQVLMDNHCLLIMVQSKRAQLLRHPLVLSLLNYKWKSYGRVVYYLNLLLYTLFMAFLNSYMLTVPPPYAINSTSTVADGSCVKVVADAQNVWGTSCTPQHAFWPPIAKYIIIVFAALSLIKEVFQIIGQKFHYFLSVTNLIEFTLYILSLLLVIDFDDYSTNTGIRQGWQWQIGSVAVFLSWMGFLLFIQNFPRFGIYVLMFTDIFRTFLSFFSVFLLFIFAFAFSFHALFQNQYSFEFWWSSIIKTIVMMIGEFEYDTLFNSEATSSDFTDQIFYDFVSYVLFILFLIIMSIIIMNLLVGLAVDDIKEVQQHAQLEGLAMQVKLALDVEYVMPQFIRRSFMRKYTKLYPNQYRRRNRIVRWFAQNKDLSTQNISNALNPEKGDLEVVSDKVENLKTRVQALRFKVRDINQRTQVIESMMKAIVDHFKISWADDNADDEN